MPLQKTAFLKCLFNKIELYFSNTDCSSNQSLKRENFFVFLIKLIEIECSKPKSINTKMSHS